MKTMLSAMKKRKSGIPEGILPVFESIVQTYSGNECDDRFMEAMGEHLTEKQRFMLWEQHGGCQVPVTIKPVKRLHWITQINPYP